jgi:hypothetical protein
MPVVGLLHMLQALKYAPGKRVGGFTVKLVPIPISRGIQFVGLNVQFASHTRPPRHY